MMSSRAAAGAALLGVALGALAAGCGASGYRRSASRHQLAAGLAAQSGDLRASAVEADKARKKEHHAAQEDTPVVPWMAPPAP